MKTKHQNKTKKPPLTIVNEGFEYFFRNIKIISFCNAC